MRFYLFSLSMLILLTGCGSAPEAALPPKLSHYATAQQQCSEFLDGKKELTSVVEKECDRFIKRLDQANNTAYDLANKKYKKGEYKEKDLVYSRERKRLELQYNKLSKAIKKATLAAIERDDIDAFTQGLAFPGNTVIAPYYDYMKSKGLDFENDPRYLDFERQESERLILKGEDYLQQGKKKKALTVFKKSAEMDNAQAARLTAILYEKKDLKKALKWHHKAVDGGIKSSYLNLGRLYERDGQEDFALNWYLRAAAEKNAKAQYRLYLYFLERNKSKAVSWLKKSADNEYAQAQYDYALVLMKKKKTDKAISFLQQASKKNYTQASDYLGEYFYNLKLFEDAYKELSLSESAGSFYLRAKMLEEGAGMKKDYKLAYTFYSRAAALGQEGTDKDLRRVNLLLSQEKRQKAAEKKREQTQHMAAMAKQCGVAPTASAIKKRGRKFHIIGTASASVGRQSFIIYGDDGEDYYLLRARGIQEDDRVDISVMSTGSTASIGSTEDDEAVDIYQFTFIKKCVIEE
ncbi:MAG: tetratricopeptide repeat protein [Campylobacterota bacterium]